MPKYFYSLCLSLFLLLFPCINNAAIVTLACPQPTSLNFIKSNQGQNKVEAFVRVLSGNTPAFLMLGITNEKHAQPFSQAFFKKGEFVCEYGTGDAPTSMIKLSNEETFGLDYCYFNQANNHQSCKGNIDYCTLKCNML